MNWWCPLARLVLNVHRSDWACLAIAATLAIDWPAAVDLMTNVEILMIRYHFEKHCADISHGHFETKLGGHV